jgi:hypothetical protein
MTQRDYSLWPAQVRHATWAAQLLQACTLSVTQHIAWGRYPRVMMYPNRAVSTQHAVSQL